MSHRSVVGLVFFVFGLQLGFTQAIPVLGVADKSDNIDSASFMVPTDPGNSYLVLLDGKPVPAGVTNRVTKVDYHEILVLRSNVTTHIVDNRLVRFVILSSKRGDPERGLIEWVPYPQIPSAGAEIAGAALYLMAPTDYPGGLDVPVIARVENPSGHARRVNGFVTCPGQPSFRIIRGHGSGFLPASGPGTSIEYSAQLGPIGAYKEVAMDAATTWTTVPSVVSGNVVWPEDSRMQITGNVTIPAGSTLTIGAGTVVKLNPLVNITNSGKTVINGTVDRPVVFTSTNSAVLPEVRTYAWGGFFIRNAGAELQANGCIFVGGGGNTGISFLPGSSHKSEQAVFLVHSSARLALTNCAVINTAGQVANGYNSDITYDHCHFQRAITAGECEGGTVIVNHSAVIEFPADDNNINAAIADGDYDAMYFTTGSHFILNSLIGFCKDDGLDSGSSASAGFMFVTNCWIESALHECNAWSGGGRQATNFGSVLMNSGQGFECGWSDSTGVTPYCFASNVLSVGNSIGYRFGDNYPSIGTGLNGFLRVTNSFALYNYRDVWGMQWRNDASGWYYRSNQMDIRSNFISQANSFHPSNTVWNGTQEGWRLAQFMTTPPDAPVGIGFAIWSNNLPMSTIFDGVPVRLSSFATNTVQVDYVFESGTRPPVSGTLTFTPGETVKRVFPYGFDIFLYASPRVTLRNPAGGELTGNTNVQFVGTMARWSPGSPFGQTTQLDYARVYEGFPVLLSPPSGQPVSIGYKYEGGGGILRTGVVNFAPGETIAWAAPPEGDLSGFDIIRFDLEYAGLPAPMRMYYVKTLVNPTPPPTTIIPFGAVWKYPNVFLSATPANWRDLTFNDSSWLSGPAQLGFSNGEENDEATLITNFGPQGQVTYYFRRTFNVTDPTVFANMTMTMIRDDGGVLHLNGREVFRSPNLPAFPAAITHTTTTLAPNGENTRDDATLNATNLVGGQNIAAVEIHQQSSTSSDVSFDLQLIGNPVPPPPPPQEVVFGQFGNQLVLAWGDATFILEQADSLDGPWTTAATASPIAIIPNKSIAQRFYRLKR